MSNLRGSLSPMRSLDESINIGLEPVNILYFMLTMALMDLYNSALLGLILALSLAV